MGFKFSADVLARARERADREYRRVRMRIMQIRKRRCRRRIDYLDVSPEAGRAIDLQRQIRKASGQQHSYSDVINSLIEESSAAI